MWGFKLPTDLSELFRKHSDHSFYSWDKQHFKTYIILPLLRFNKASQDRNKKSESICQSEFSHSLFPVRKLHPLKLHH